MRLSNLISALAKWDRAGIWAFPVQVLQLLFKQPERSLLKALSAHVRSGHLLRIARGLYVNPSARSLPTDVLAELVPYLRPWDFNYLSLESALSESGNISQLPNRLTVMTTGRSHVFHTPYGTIEFVHTKRSPDELGRAVQFDASRRLHVAPPQIALRDLRRAGRNLGLVSS